MSLRHQTSILTNEHRGGLAPIPRHPFFFRVLYIWIVVIALLAVSICTYQGSENLIDWLIQLGI